MNKWTELVVVRRVIIGQREGGIGFLIKIV